MINICVCVFVKDEDVYGRSVSVSVSYCLSRHLGLL